MEPIVKPISTHLNRVPLACVSIADKIILDSPIPMRPFFIAICPLSPSEKCVERKQIRMRGVRMNEHVVDSYIPTLCNSVKENNYSYLQEEKL